MHRQADIFRAHLVRLLADKVQELVAVHKEQVVIIVPPAEGAVVVDQPLAIVMQRPGGRVEDLPAQQPVVLDTQRPVIPRIVHVAAAIG